MRLVERRRLSLQEMSIGMPQRGALRNKCYNMGQGHKSALGH